MKKLLALLILTSTLTAQAQDLFSLPSAPFTGVEIDDVEGFSAGSLVVSTTMGIATNKAFESQQDRFQISLSSNDTINVWAYRDERQTENGFEPAKNFSCFITKESIIWDLAYSLVTNASEETSLKIIGTPGGKCTFINHTKDSRYRLNAQSNNDDISKVFLVNSVTNEVIQELANGMTISLEDVGTNLNIVAETRDGFSSVRFSSASEGYSRNEAVAPFAYRGDVGGNYYNWNPGVSVFSLTVTPYKGSPGSSEAGTARTIGVSFQ